MMTGAYPTLAHGQHQNFLWNYSPFSKSQYILLLMESPGWDSSSLHAQDLSWTSRDHTPYPFKNAPFQPLESWPGPAAHPLVPHKTGRFGQRDTCSLKTLMWRTRSLSSAVWAGIYKCASMHICSINNKHGKYIFPRGLWDFPSAIPSAAIAAADLISF